MTQIATGFWPCNPNTTSGSLLAQKLSEFEEAYISSQSGNVAPAVVNAGTWWLDTSNGTNYVLKFYSGVTWISVFSFVPATGTSTPANSLVKSVNTRIGDVRVKELYDSTETTLVAQSSTNGVDIVINQNPNPSSNLLGTVGRIAYDSNLNQFVGRDNVGWSPFGGGGFAVNDQTVTAGGKINLLSFPAQSIKLTSASAVTLAAQAFSIPTDLAERSLVILIGTDNTNTQTINYGLGGAAAIAEVTNVTAVADVANSLEGLYFILKAAVAVWFDFGTTPEPAHGLARSIKVTLAPNDTDIIVATKIAAAVDADAEYGASSLGAVVTITNTIPGAVADASSGTSTMAIAILTQGVNAGAGQILFGNQTLAEDYVLGFIYDKVRNVMIQTYKNY